MNTKYTLKNFRVFDKEGSTFELAPVTILTGPNGSGKSSVSKSLQMIKGADLRVGKIIDLSGNGHQLGRFDKITNWESNENEITIEFSYTSFLLPLHKNLNVRITLRNENKQKPHEARIVAVDIVTLDGRTLLHDDIARYPNSENSSNRICEIEDDVDYSVIKDDVIKRVKEWQLMYNSLKSIEVVDEHYLISKIGGYKDLLPILFEYVNSARKVTAIDKKIMQRCVPTTPKQYDESEKTTIDSGSTDLIFPYLPLLMNVQEAKISPAFVETGIVYDLDILKTLDSVRKEDISSLLTNRVYDNLSAAGLCMSDFNPCFRQDLNEIIYDYIQSPYILFSQYYKSLEDEFLRRRGLRSINKLDVEMLRSRYVFSHDEFKDAYQKTKDVESMTLLEWSNDEWNSHQWADGELNKVYDKIKKIRLRTIGIGFGNSIKREDDNPKYREAYDMTYSQYGYVLKFTLLYDFLKTWCSASPSSKEEADKIKDNESFLKLYFLSIYNEIFSCVDILSNTEYISGIRSNAKRLYAFEDSGNLSKVLFQYLRMSETVDYWYDIDHKLTEDMNMGSKQDGFERKYSKGTFLKKGLKVLLNIDDVSFETDDEGVGVYIYLTKNINGKKHQILLSDMGYGNTPLLSMLLQIDIAIMDSIKRNNAFKESIGIGEIFDFLGDDYFTRTTICIEEPETNLHPAVQSRLADVFKMATEEYPVNFILETHSEYLIRRSQVLVAEAKYKDEQELANKCPFKVYYLPEIGTGKPYDMEYQTNGRFIQEFGAGFFDEASNLAFKLF